MSRLKLLSTAFALLLSTLACATVLGEESYGSRPAFGEVSPNNEQPVAPQQIDEPVEIASCPVITDQIVNANTDLDLSNDLAKDFNNAEDDNEVTYLVTYTIDGDEIRDPYFENVSASLQDEQNDLAAHQALWDYYAALIPGEYRDMLSEFAVMTDGEDNILAAVWQTSNDPYHWGMEVDIADTSDYYYFSFTLIHEFAHLLTLGPNQVPPDVDVFNNPDDYDLYDQAIAACPNYFPGEGCSNSDSYINAFYNQFWIDIYDEWDEINYIEDDDEYYDALDAFYYKYEDRFLTDYSATHPAEDIAEAFGFFIFAGQPDGSTIAEQKILFFYQYPELVQLRQEILSNVCVNFPE